MGRPLGARWSWVSALRATSSSSRESRRASRWWWEVRNVWVKGPRWRPSCWTEPRHSPRSRPRPPRLYFFAVLLKGHRYDRALRRFLPLLRGVDLGVDQVYRRRPRRLVLPADLPGRGVPDSVGQHGEYAAHRRLPLREQGALRRRGAAGPRPASVRA